MDRKLVKKKKFPSFLWRSEVVLLVSVKKKHEICRESDNI